MNNPVSTAIQFLRDNTALNTDEAVGYEDPNNSGTILVEHLFRDGEEVQALVYLDAEGRHDFEVAD